MRLCGAKSVEDPDLNSKNTEPPLFVIHSYCSDLTYVPEQQPGLGLQEDLPQN